MITRIDFQRDDWQYALGCDRFDIDPDSATDLYRVPGHTDGGIWKHAHENLMPFRDKYQYAVIILDADFEPRPSAEVLRDDISKGMIATGWGDRFAVVVIEPELEAWLFAPNINVALAFSLRDFDELRGILEAEELWTPGDAKPNDLKRARNRAAELGGKKTGGPIFKAVFGNIPSKALKGCLEPGFGTLRTTVQQWFPTKIEAWKK